MGRANICKLAASAMMVLYAAQSTRGNGVYLKQVGPSPLRFSLATASFSFALPAALIERPATTNSQEIAVNQPMSVETNALALQPSAVFPPTNNLPTNPILPKIPAPTPSASEVLVVSPQMLTEFFKPGPDGTNSPGAMVVPAPVGFTPPSVTPSSQATYRSP